MPPALPLWPPLQLLSGPCFQGPQRPSGPDSEPHCSQTGPPGSRHQTSLGTGLRWAGWGRTARQAGSVLRTRGDRERSACGSLRAPSSRRNLVEDSRGLEQNPPPSWCSTLTCWKKLSLLSNVQKRRVTIPSTRVWTSIDSVSLLQTKATEAAVASNLSTLPAQFS
jgi:hypothetical protein